MKRVSFKAAKALKEAGYPQEGPIYYTTEGELFDWNELEVWSDKYYFRITAPYALDVWLWLIREKRINLSPIYWNSDNSWHIPNFIKDKKDDPEEAIVAAIEYLVDNDLIK